jgi:glycosyltransferase involved in cell wall biosynthesis
LVEFLGEVNEPQKQALLGNARALLFPIDWPEPFGLVMIEALAAGTPVIARPCGSVPEVLRDGVTGLFCASEDEMVGAVSRVAALDRTACRREFEQRFTAPVMVQNYLKVYEAALTAHVSVPYTVGETAWSQRLNSRNGADEILPGAPSALLTTLLPPE